MDKEMQKALKADGEKLRQLTGEDHGPWTTCTDCHGFGSHEIPTPQHDDPYYCRVDVCLTCNGTGFVEGFDDLARNDTARSHARDVGRRKMTAYYNENDPYCAQWLRNLIVAGHIAPGDVDERDIRDVRADDVRGYTQCHFFAGIGGWSYALRLAGWPDDQECWTGSCPCQPLSVAGQRQGHADERHLWPAFHCLISKCSPAIVFGEQVAGPDGREWLAGVRADLEALGYACGAADLCAASVGAPHARQRVYWLAKPQVEQSHRSGTARNGRRKPANCGGPLRVANANGRIESHRELQRSWKHGFWTQDSIAVRCTDGLTRRIPIEPAFQPMADGLRNRIPQLRAYGNAIVPQVAAEFIAAIMSASS